MSDHILSLIRTTVPVAVGTALAWLGRKTGVVLSEDASADVMLAVTGLVIVGYYAAARQLERRWPWLGRLLLGSSKAPTYVDSSPAGG